MMMVIRVAQVISLMVKKARSDERKNTDGYKAVVKREWLWAGRKGRRKGEGEWEEKGRGRETRKG